MGAMQRALGIDFGEKRIGVAVSDPGRIMAFPSSTLTYNGKMAKAVKIVAAVIEEKEATLVVVGLPFSLDGTRGKQADRVSTFIGELRKKLGPEIRLEEWDERLTSVQAGRVLDEVGVNSRKRRGKVDMIAAALVLQAFLDRHSGDREEQPCEN